MQLLISDANILIDLEEGHLLVQLFQMPYRFSIPDILFEEELDEEHGHLPSMGLHILELNSNAMSYAVELISKYPKTSRNDCFALALAAQEETILLTGDKALRSAAKNESVSVNGTIWLMEQMIQWEVITVEEASTAYDHMKLAGRRLPWSLVATSLKRQI